MRGFPHHARKERITIQQRAAGEDDNGQPIGAWVDIATVWAHADHGSGREMQTGDTAVSEVSVKFRVAMRSDITAGMRVMWKGKPYDIEAFAPVMRDMDIYCKQGTGDGR